MHHKPVLLQEVLECLDPKPGSVVVDGTLGSGGHAAAILEKIGPSGKLIGLDQDPDAIARCRSRFSGDERVVLVQRNFRHIAGALDELMIEKADAILFDIGMSSDQLADGKRGFSFQREGELDMRMNPEAGMTAAHCIATLPESELARVFYELGEERRSRRFARKIVEERRIAPIDTTQRLSQVLAMALSGPAGRFASKGKRPVWAPRNPGTRVFQALRILVNDELGALRDGIDGAWSRLAPGGRFGIISFHSLEDRIVKEKFRFFSENGTGELVNRKPVVAKRSEIINNPRARSAKLRVIGKTA